MKRIAPPPELQEFLDRYHFKNKSDGEYTVTELKSWLGVSENSARKYIAAEVKANRMILVGERMVDGGLARCYSFVKNGKPKKKPSKSKARVQS